MTDEQYLELQNNTLQQVAALVQNLNQHSANRIEVYKQRLAKAMEREGELKAENERLLKANAEMESTLKSMAELDPGKWAEQQAKAKAEKLAKAQRERDEAIAKIKAAEEAITNLSK